MKLNFAISSNSRILVLRLNATLIDRLPSYNHFSLVSESVSYIKAFLGLFSFVLDRGSCDPGCCRESKYCSDLKFFTV